MSNLNTHQTHPLIPREQTYLLDRKIVSFHSTDRDISKWPRANHFEIMLPETLKNIQSMRLDTISIPNDQYVFSREYQNTKLSFSLKTYNKFTYAIYYTIEIEEGSYTPEELAIEIQTKMNNKIAELHPPTLISNFICQYNKVTNTFWFGNEGSPFTLRFDVKHEYGLLCPNQTIVWNRYTNWGLPSYLGYKKTIYQGEPTPAVVLAPPGPSIPAGGPFGFDYSTKKWLTTKDNWFVNVTNPIPAMVENLTWAESAWSASAWYYPCADESLSTYKPGEPCGPPAFISKEEWGKKAKIDNMNIMGEDVIYMEVDKYNTMDEIEPYSKNTTAECSNDYHGKVNSAFAKIPLPCTAFSQIFDSRNAFLMNISHYHPPLERVTRLKFKFRYHDGRLVDFKSLSLSFSIEFNMLRNEQARKMNVRIPGLYHL